MSKFVSFIILGAVVLVAVAAININEVNAREETRFVQISVLAEDQANYGVDEDLTTIPAVSAEIIEDKVHDIESTSSVPVITYTSLPEKKSGDQNNNDTQSEDKAEVRKDHGNNGGGNQNDKGNNGSNQNKEKEKEREKKTRPDKDKGTGSSNANSNANANANKNVEDK